MRYSAALVLATSIGAIAHPGTGSRNGVHARDQHNHLRSIHGLRREAIDDRKTKWTGTVMLGDVTVGNEDSGDDEDDAGSGDDDSVDISDPSTPSPLDISINIAKAIVIPDNVGQEKPAAAPAPAPAPEAAPAPAADDTEAATPAPAPVPVTVQPKPQPTEPQTDTISDYAEQALDEHNTLRATIGAAPLTWSDELAAAAKVLADRCYWPATGSPHDTSIAPGGYGQNMAAGQNDIRNVIQDQWFDEVNNPAGEQGHYTQVVWKATKQVGCATSSCGSDAYGGVTVCNYMPPGNVAGGYAANV